MTIFLRRCTAKLFANRTVRVVVGGMSGSGRTWLLAAVRSLLEATFGETALAGSLEDRELTALNGSRALQVSPRPFARGCT